MTGESPFSIITFRPSMALLPYVQCFHMIESAAGCVNRVLPAMSPVLALRLKGGIAYEESNATTLLPAFILSGIRNTPRYIRYNADSANLLVIFRVGGLSEFFQEPVHELFNESISLEHFVLQEAVTRLETQLAEAGSNVQRIAVIEAFLLDKLLQRKPDYLVAEALQQMRASAGIVAIGEMADRLFISQDAFEKRFRRVVGASPKQFASLIRLTTIVNRRQKQPADFTGMALDAGYFDQAHFNKAFKQFTGQTPSDFFKCPPLW